MKMAVTGHRPNKLGNDYSLKFSEYGEIKKAVYRELEAIVAAYKPTELISGMALGVDQIFAKVALRMDIPLTAAVPFEGQEKKWSLDHQEAYLDILAHANNIVFTSEGGYAAWKMQKRNEWMVDNSDILIAVWDGTVGGTYNCIRYAEKKNKKIIYIHLKELLNEKRGNTNES